MKNLVTFLIIAVMLAFSGPVLAEISAASSPISEASTLEALKDLKLRQHTGVITVVDLDEQRLVIKNRRGEYRLSIMPETQVKRSREKLNQAVLEPGMRVTVKYWEQDGRKIAHIVKLAKD